MAMQNFKSLACFCDCTGRFASDLVGTQIVGFVTQQLILKTKYFGTQIRLPTSFFVIVIFFFFFFFFFLIFFFNSVLRPFQDYFSSYETGQSVGGLKQENPKKNHLTHPQAEHGLSHMWLERGSNPHQTQP